jgi:hypothetical protein
VSGDAPPPLGGRERLAPRGKDPGVTLSPDPEVDAMCFSRYERELWRETRARELADRERERPEDRPVPAEEPAREEPPVVLEEDREREPVGVS